LTGINAPATARTPAIASQPLILVKAESVAADIVQPVNNFGASAMTTNVGMMDRILRVIAGLALIALALGYFPGYQSAWGWIGVVPLVTGLFGTCPLYSLLGVNTCST
jgi:hypothetical protein